MSLNNTNNTQNYPNNHENNQVIQFEESKDFCCGLCCFSFDDIISFFCFFIGIFFTPLWCCFYLKNRKSKIFVRKLFAYLSCFCFVVILLLLIFIGYSSYKYFMNTLLPENNYDVQLTIHALTEKINEMYRGQKLDEKIEL